MSLTDAQRAVLAELWAHGKANDAAVADRAGRMLNLDPETAELVAVIATAAGARRAVEVGTSNGYSTIWLAAHVDHVVSIDRAAAKHELARANLARAGVADRVELLTGDATALVADLIGPIDLVFFDADRRSAPQQLGLLLPKLSPRAGVMHDNAVSNPDELAEYLAMVGRLPGFVHTVVPVGKGLSVASRNGVGR
jgi:predicted O-methyltransferase YrrM